MPSLVAVNVGNTRTQVAALQSATAESVTRYDNDDLPSIVAGIIELHRKLGGEEVPVVMASVNETVSGRIQSAAQDQLRAKFYLIGDDLPPPIGVQLDRETITGVDRLLNAAAAYSQVEQACVVIDVGTAITIDFVDGEGTFHGGAIAPGAMLQLQALSDHTAALPALDFTPPDDESFGKSTAQAMLQGVYHGIRGLAWRLVERYAEEYGAFPQVIVTGGDAEKLFGDDELIDNIVPDLTLMGIYESARKALGVDHDDDVDADSPLAGS